MSSPAAIEEPESFRPSANGLLRALTQDRWHYLAIVVFVAALRLLYLGDPAVNIDEQFYLVVTDRWLHGGLIPYIDIWDRKPIGIFLVYAPAVLLFKNAVIGYQLLGLLSVLATCLIVYRMGLWLGGRMTALAAALFYAAILMLWSGAGGQTPVFYNLPIAAGAFLIMRCLRAPPLAFRSTVWSFLAASLLFGIGLQIKYICVLEIMFLSLLGLAGLAARQRVPLSRLIALALGMIAAGLAPTLAAGAAYAAIGHWHEFFFANFQSIFGKKVWRFSPAIYVLNVLSAVAYGLVFWAWSACALARRFARAAAPVDPWLMAGLLGWLACAVIGALSLGNPILHYFLPTAAPLALLSALGLARVAARGPTPALRFSLGLGATLLVAAIAAVVIYTQSTRLRGAAEVYPVAAYMNAQMKVRPGCPYVFDDFPILYYLTHCSAPSIYAFPNHLTETAELHALAVDALDELRRVLSTGPSMIFVRRPFAPELDAQAIAILEAALRDHYTLGKRFAADNQEFDVYLKTD